MGCEEKAGNYTASKLNINLSLYETQRQFEEQIRLPAVLTLTFDVSEYSASIYIQEVDRDRAGRSGEPIPVGARFSSQVQTSPGARSASCIIGTGSLSRG